jgi:thiol-disulfide isomerase/thioredoxin
MMNEPHYRPEALQAKSEATRWHDVPLVFIVAPSCPHCRAGKPIIIRSQTENDGSVTRRCVCRQCSRRFLLVVEPVE